MWKQGRGKQEICVKMNGSMRVPLLKLVDLGIAYAKNDMTMFVFGNARVQFGAFKNIKLPLMYNVVARPKLCDCL